jgi:cell division septation protein DedD
MTSLRLLIILLLVLNALAFAAMRGWLGSTPPAGEAGRIASQLDPQRIRLASEAAAPPQATAEPVSAAQAPSPALPEPEEAPLEPPPPPAPATEDVEQAPAENTGVHTVVADSEDAIAAAAEASPQGSGEDAAPGDAAETTADAANSASSAAPEATPEAAPASTSVSPPAVCHAWANLTADQAERLSQRLRRVGATPIRSRTETPDSWWVRIPPQGSRAEAERRVIELNLLGVTDTFIVQESGPTQYAVSLGVFKTENRARVLLGQLRTRGVTNAGIEPRMTTTYRLQASFPASELRAVESAAPGLRGKRQTCAAR